MTALVVGGHSGFGAELCALFGEKSQGVSRTTGHNIWKKSQRLMIAQMSLEHDLFINFAHADFMQTHLLYDVGAKWERSNKAGYIFNIGSYVTYEEPQNLKKWCVSKYSLDIANRQFAKQIESGALPFRMTLLKLGIIDSEKSRSKPHWLGYGHSAQDLANLIKMLYAADPRNLIHELVVHPQKPASSSAILKK